MQIEKTILKNLLRNEEYTRKVIPFLKSEYFNQSEDKTLFNEIRDFVAKYSSVPSIDAIRIEVSNLNNISEQTLGKINQSITEYETDKIDTNMDWLVESTEKFCQEKAIYHAIMTSIEIMDNRHADYSKGAIPQLLSDALGVTFDPNVGHDFFENWEERYEYYHRAEEKLPFDLEFFNRITKSGIPRKTLNMVLGGIHCVAPDTQVRIRFRKQEI